MDMYQKRKQRKENAQNSDVKLDKTSINWVILPFVNYLANLLIPRD